MIAFQLILLLPALGPITNTNIIIISSSICGVVVLLVLVLVIYCWKSHL